MIMNESEHGGSGARSLVYRILRYTPNLVRDEWVNIGVVVFDEKTGERRMRLIEEEEEYNRVRRLHRDADDRVLRLLRQDLESRFLDGGKIGGSGEWWNVLEKFDSTLSNVLQLAPQKGILHGDLDAEIERLYADHIAVPWAQGRVGLPGSRSTIRHYCAQVFKQARLWERIDKSVRVEEFTFQGDPMRLDYSYRRNGTRGYLQALSVSRAPGDAKELAYTVERIAAKAKFATEFAAVTDVALVRENERHQFVQHTLRDAGIEPIPMDGFAVWVAKLRPMLQ
jgi:hypothetical protein